MEFRDAVITPVVILILLGVAMALRSKVTTPETRKFFLPALLVKLIGAVTLGLIYQFYYGGGDTLNYFHHGITPIWDAFLDSPLKAFKIIFSDDVHQPDTIEYTSRIWFTANDPSSLFVIRIASVLSILTLNTYSAIAVFFAAFSFSGGWAFYRALLRFYPQLHWQFALAIFFIPSVVFWGSGLMKDTLTLGALCWLAFASVRIFFERRRLLLNILLFLGMVVIIYSIKIYVVLCFIPALLLWVGYDKYVAIENRVLKIMLLPLILAVVAGGSYFAILKIGEGNARYSIENLGNAAEVTAKWINYVSDLEGGSGYTLGDFDYSPAGIARKFLPAIFVTLFQPFLWQASNPVMLISALESTALFFISLYVLGRSGLSLFWRLAQQNSLFLFCLVFSIAFAASVGLSTYNFGSLVRYKIPLLPFYGVFLSILWYYSKRDKKFS